MSAAPGHVSPTEAPSGSAAGSDPLARSTDRSRHRTSPHFRAALECRESNDPALAREARAAELLEKAGWELAVRPDEYESHVAGNQPFFDLVPPGAPRSWTGHPHSVRFPFAALPSLAVVSGAGDPGEPGGNVDTAFPEEVLRWLENGYCLTLIGEREVPELPSGRLAHAVKVAWGLPNWTVWCRHDDCDFPVSPKGSPAEFEARMRRLAVILERFDEVEAFRDYFVSERRMEERERVLHLLDAVPVEEVASHVDAMARLATAGAAQSGYRGMAGDYQALLDSRDPSQSLDRCAAEYASVLAALASAGQAEQAASTYASLRRREEREGGARPFDEFAREFVTALATSGDARIAREMTELVYSVNHAAADPLSSSASVVRNGDWIVVGGVAVPIRK